MNKHLAAALAAIGLGVVLIATVDPVIGIAVMIVVPAVLSSLYENERATEGLPAVRYDGSQSNMPVSPRGERTIGLMPWGGALLETGPQSAILVLIPVVGRLWRDEIDRAKGMPGLVGRIVVFPGVDPSLVDRAAEVFGVGDEQITPVVPWERVLEEGDLRLEGGPDGTIFARWPGYTALVGTRMPLQLLADHVPDRAVGSFALLEEGAEVPDLLDFFMGAGPIALFDDDGHQGRVAEFFSTCGARCTLLGAWPSSKELEQHCHVYLVVGDYEGFERTIRTALERYADDPAILLQHAVGTLMQGDEDRALKRFEKAADAGAAEAWCSIAALRMRAGDLDGALAAATRGVQLLPDDPFSQEAERNVLEAIEIGTHPDDAVPVHTFPVHADVASGLAQELLAEGRIEEGMHLLERAVALDPLSPERVMAVEDARARSPH